MLNDRELYVLEKLEQAMDCLETHPGRIQERLEEAYNFLVLAQPNELSDPKLRDMLAEIKNDLTSDTPVGSEGRLRATLGNMDDEAARTIAERIRRLREELKGEMTPLWFWG